jgi:hypothetical protein
MNDILRNPYRTGGPVRQHEIFVGREREIEQIIQALELPQSVSLYGERRIGKTSLLYRLREQAKTELDDRPLVYMTMETIPDEDAFYRRVARELGVDNYTGPLDLEDALRSREHPPILLLDEFEKTLDSGDFSDDFFHRLRGWDIEDLLLAVFATLRPLSSYVRKGEKTSPFGNTCLPVALGPLNEEDAKDLLKPIVKLNQNWPTNWLDRVLEQTECKPWHLQLFGYLAWDHSEDTFEQVWKTYQDQLVSYTREGESRIRTTETKRTGPTHKTELNRWQRLAKIPGQWIAGVVALGSILALLGMMAGSSLLVGLGAFALFMAFVLIIIR